MAKEENKLSKYSNGEMIELLELVEVVLSYYDNEARANVNDVNGEGKAAYTAATDKILKYSKLKDSIFAEIERRVSELC